MALLEHAVGDVIRLSGTVVLVYLGEGRRPNQITLACKDRVLVLSDFNRVPVKEGDRITVTVKFREPYIPNPLPADPFLPAPYYAQEGLLEATAQGRLLVHARNLSEFLTGECLELLPRTAVVSVAGIVVSVGEATTALDSEGFQMQVVEVTIEDQVGLHHGRIVLSVPEEYLSAAEAFAVGSTVFVRGGIIARFRGRTTVRVSLGDSRRDDTVLRVIPQTLPNDTAAAHPTFRPDDDEAEEELPPTTLSGAPAVKRKKHQE